MRFDREQIHCWVGVINIDYPSPVDLVANQILPFVLKLILDEAIFESFAVNTAPVAKEKQALARKKIASLSQQGRNFMAAKDGSSRLLA